MMGNELSRREFIKLISALPLIELAKDTTLSPMRNSIPQGSGVPNILILIFDALSASNMSLYGYPRQTTPNIASFADSATIFHRHYAGGNFTTPGTASILTGVYPWSHRAFQPRGTVIPKYKKNNLFHNLTQSSAQKMVFTHNDLVSMLLHQFSEDIDIHKKTVELCLFDEFFLADRVFPSDRNSAYEGERLISRGLLGKNSALPSAVLLSGLHRVWRNRNAKSLNSAFKDEYPRGLPSTNRVNRFFLLEDAVEWIQLQIKKSPQPYLGYFHFLPPHRPYNPPKDFIGIYGDDWRVKIKPQHFFSQGIFRKEANKKRGYYDEFIAFVDAEFGKLINFMQSEGLLEDTLLVLTSDHGEMFERGILYHSTETLYEPITRVPLIIHNPGQKSRINVHSLTSCVDLLPTLLHASGQAIPDWCEGEVLPTFSEVEIDPERSVYTIEAKSNPVIKPLTVGTVAMVKDRYKLIYYFGYDGFDDQYELYDLNNDPEELEDLYAPTNSIAKDLISELRMQIELADEPYKLN
jgi:arylsulfatase A-like enzyme